MNIDSNYHSDSMNGSRPRETFNQQKVQLINQINELKGYNDKLYEENLNYCKRIRKLEEYQCQILQQIRHETNDTTTNFFLLSQISDIWTELAKENIINCFIDFISHPELLYNLIQEMAYTINLLLKEQIDSIVNSFTAQWNISSSEKNNKLVYESIRSIIKEFYYEIFESKCSRNDDVFDKFKRRYLLYIQEKMKGVITHAIQAQFIEDLDSVYFKKMYLNIQRIIFFVELKNNNNSHIDICDRDNRVINPIEMKRNECICVEGLLNEQRSVIVLLDAPKTASGYYAYKQFKPIVISYSKRAENNIRPLRTNNSEKERNENQSEDQGKEGGIKEKMHLSISSVNDIEPDIDIEDTKEDNNLVSSNNGNALNTFPLPKKLQLYDSLRLTQLHSNHNTNNNNKPLSYQRINYLLLKNKGKGRSHSKTPIKGLCTFYLSKEKHNNNNKKLRNTMMINSKCPRNAKKINNTSNPHEQKNKTCTTEINDTTTNLNAKSVYVKYKETISMKLKEKIKQFAYNINSPTSIHIKRNAQITKGNMTQKNTINHHFSNSYTHLGENSDEKIGKGDKDMHYNTRRSLLKQILSPLRTTPNIKIKTFKGFTGKTNN